MRIEAVHHGFMRSLECPTVRVLLVDDDPAYRMIVVRLLRESVWAEFDLDVVATPDQAIALDADLYDVILLDYQLGSRTGLDVLRAWRSRNAAAPVIMLTAMGGHTTDIAAAEAGAYEYLDKADLDPRLLERAIRYSLALARSNRTTREALRMQSALARAARALLEVTVPGAVAQQVVRAVVEELGASAASVAEALPDGTAKWVAAYPDLQGPGATSDATGDRHMDADLAMRAIRVRRPVLSDTQAAPPRTGSMHLSAPLQTSSAAFPLITADGVLGVLQVHGRDAAFFSAPVLDALSTYSSHAALALRGVRLHEEFQHAQKMEAIGRLAGGVAHDFNNLLTAILGYTNLLASGDLESEQRAAVDEIESAGNRAATLTRQLLAFGRRQVLAPEVLDVNEVVTNVQDLLLRLIGENVQLVVLLEAVVATTLLDRGQLEQALMNLAVNARDAMTDGGTLVFATRTLNISERCGTLENAIEPGRYVELSVTDTGCGMDNATRVRAFEPFFTTKPVGKGTGLGLASVLGIVHQSGGRVTLESAVGKGTTVALLFPVKEELPIAHTPPVQEIVAHVAGHGTVLVAEDQEHVRSLLCRVLRRAGYRVIEAQDGDEALRRLDESAAVDLVVSDVIMPRVGGRALVTAMRQRGHRARVVLISGYTQEQEGAEQPFPPDVGFLMKPFTPGELTAKVREYLGE